MRKIIIALLLINLMSYAKAQRVSVGYTHHFKPMAENFLKNKKVVPQLKDQLTIQYTQQLGKLPITVNAAAAIGRKKPPLPRYIKTWFTEYTMENNFEADSAVFSTPNTNSIDIMTGIGYMLPHSKSAKVLFILNADFGWSFNSRQTLNFYYNENITNKTEVQKSQFIINPNVRTNVNVTKELDLYVNAGYSNLGGFNAGAGVSIHWRHTCLICGRKHSGKCKQGYTSDDNTSNVSENIIRKHTCLICGRRHRGTCKYGYTNETSLTELLQTFKAVGGDAKLYHSEESETDCNPTRGIACTDDIAVSDDFDIDAFDKYVATGNPERIKDIFLKNDMTKFLPGLMQLPNSKKVIEALKFGNLTLKKIPALKYSYQLGTPENIAKSTGKALKVTFRKKHDYVGHVTLLR